MKSVYFFSDAHLGSWAIEHGRMHERRVVSFLESLRNSASAVYILGDLFDFWHEYKYVIPKGYTRLLGKISSLTDEGIEVHFFTGNHDLWVNDYFEKECGMIVHRDISYVTEIYGKTFYLAHGDGLGKRDRKYNLLRALFHNPICKKLFASIHPRWGMWFGLRWAQQSRLHHEAIGGEPPYEGEDKEEVVVFAKEYLQTHPSINYFIFGHRHIELDISLKPKARLLILGDWVKRFTYAVFDGEHLLMEKYIEGETKL